MLFPFPGHPLNQTPPPPTSWELDGDMEKGGEPCGEDDVGEEGGTRGHANIILCIIEVILFL